MPAPSAPRGLPGRLVQRVVGARTASTPRHSFPALLVLLLGLGVLLIGAYLIFSPFAAPLLLALVAAITAYPLFEAILVRIGPTRRGLASGLTCAFLVAVVFLPLGWLGWSIVEQIPTREVIVENWQAFSKRVEASSWHERGWFREGWTWVSNFVNSQQFWDQGQGARPVVKEQEGPAQVTPAPEVKPGPGDQKPDAARAASSGVAWARLGDALGWIQSSLLPVVSGTAQLFLKFCLMLFVLFFFLKDAAPLLKSVNAQIPLPPAQKDRVATALVRVSRSIIRGTLGTALIQGICATVAYLIVGIPAIFWGFVTTVAALVPPFGTTLITLPMVGYLFLHERYWQAVVLGIVAIGIGLLDNVLKPILMREGLRVHSIWLFLSILGGLNAFGPMGMIYGPMVLVLLGTFIALLAEEGRREPHEEAAPARNPG